MTRHELRLYLSFAETQEELHSYITEFYDDLIHPSFTASAAYEPITSKQCTRRTVTLKQNDIVLLQDHKDGEFNLCCIVDMAFAKCACFKRDALLVTGVCLKDGREVAEYVFGGHGERKVVRRLVVVVGGE